MTKRYDEPIEVDLPVEGAVGDGAPSSFSWRGRKYDVDQHLKSWREAGEWWDRTRLHDREYHRLIAHPAGQQATGELDPDGGLERAPTAVYDLYNDRLRATWRLARVWD